jgi:hypothetical protein
MLTLAHLHAAAQPKAIRRKAGPLDWRVYLHANAHSLLLRCSQRWRTMSSPRTTRSSSNCGTSSGRWDRQLWNRLLDCSTTATFSNIAQSVTALQAADCMCMRPEA